MRLTLNGLHDREAFEREGITLPAFDVAAMQRTAQPRWLHFGPGNIFRGFIARVAHEMLEAGLPWPITAVATRDPESLDIQLRAHDLMSLVVTIHPDGVRDLRVVAGLNDSVATANHEDFEQFVAMARDPHVTLISFTITEKGYVITDSRGELSVDLDADPRGHHSDTMLLLASLLLHRFEAGAAPITLLSCDNFSHNGDKLRESILRIASGWIARGTAPEDFLPWLEDRSTVAFPISVIDKITPGPSAQLSHDLTALGFEDMELTPSAGPALAGFVNTEPTEYLLIEDSFAAARPPFEDFGVIITDRRTCDDFERMKVTTCLNPLHTALAIGGCLLRFPTIDSEMRDPALAELARRLGWDEGFPVVVDPGVVTPERFLAEVLTVRFPNPYLPDNPARIAADTSQKIPIRFGETIKGYLERGLDLSALTAMPLVFALWCRYLMGVADDGAAFTPSPDPLLEELAGHLAGVRLGEQCDAHAALAPILSNPRIFGVDLYTTPLAAKTEDLFASLFTGPGAIRATIDREMSTS